MGFLSSVRVWILEAGLGKARKDILRKQLIRNGGDTIESSQISECKDITQVLVGENVTFERAWKALDLEFSKDSNLIVVRADWLSCCLKTGSVVDHVPFVVKPLAYDAAADVQVNSTSNAAATVNSTGSNDGIQSASEITSAQLTNVGKADSRSTCTEPVSPDRSVSPSSGGAPASALPITASVVGSGYAGRKRKSEHVWLDANSGSDLDSSEDGCDSDDNLSQLAVEHHMATVGKRKKLKKYMCDQPSTESVNHNKHITDKLSELMKIHEINRDQFRVLGYRKAITALRNYPKVVETRDEVQAINGIGKRIADKVVEIMDSGGLRRLNHVDPKMEVIQLFMGIWGAGPETAKKWHSEGFRTLDDIRQKATLTRQQVVGLRLYDDLNKRMPRSEAAEIEATVTKAALSIIPGLEMTTCGSYRRGKATCGDVDVLITHPDGRSHHNVFKPLLAKLHEIEFLTDDLVSHEFNGDQQKYFGVCRLGPDRVHRRLDIITVPYKELPCALLYFTGSGLFNRSMRCKARHMGMSLSEHALKTGVVRKGNEKVSEGVALPVTCEKDVFDYLGMQFLEPHERER